MLQVGRGIFSPVPLFFIMPLNIIVKGSKKSQSEEEQLSHLRSTIYDEGAQEKASYAQRQRDVARAHEHLRGTTMENMKPVGAIDARTFLRWEQAEPGFWNDNASRKKFYNDNPECRIQAD